MRLVPTARGSEAYRAALRSLTAESNERLFRLVEESSLAFEAGTARPSNPKASASIANDARADDRPTHDYVADNLDPLALIINADCASGPVFVPQIH